MRHSKTSLASSHPTEATAMNQFSFPKSRLKVNFTNRIEVSTHSVVCMSLAKHQKYRNEPSRISAFSELTVRKDRQEEM